MTLSGLTGMVEGDIFTGDLANISFVISAKSEHGKQKESPQNKAIVNYNCSFDLITFT